MSKENAEIMEDYMKIKYYINLLSEDKNIANNKEFIDIIDKLNEKNINNYDKLLERINIIRKRQKEKRKERI